MRRELAVIITCGVFFWTNVLLATPGGQYQKALELRNKAYQAKQRKRYRQAVGFMRQALYAAPKSRKLFFVRELVSLYLEGAKAVRSQGKYELSLKWFHKGEALARKEWKEPRMVKFFRWEIARTWEALGDWEQAKKAYFWAKRYRNVGAILLREKKYREALAFYRSLVKCPRENKVYYVRGAADKLKMGEPLLCPKDRTKMYLSALDAIGQVHLQLKEYEKAESAFRAGLSLAKTPLEKQTYESLLGSVYELLGKPKDAFRAYRRARQPLRMAKVLQKEKKDKLAAAYYRQVIAEEEEKLDKYLQMKEQFRRLRPKVSLPSGAIRRPASAPAMVDSYSAIDLNISRCYERLGDAYTGLGEHKKARKMYYEAQRYATSYLRATTQNGRDKFQVRMWELSGYGKYMSTIQKKIQQASLREAESR